MSSVVCWALSVSHRLNKPLSRRHQASLSLSLQPRQAAGLPLFLFLQPSQAAGLSLSSPSPSSTAPSRRTLSSPSWTRALKPKPFICTLQTPAISPLRTLLLSPPPYRHNIFTSFFGDLYTQRILFFIICVYLILVLSSLKIAIKIFFYKLKLDKKTNWLQ